MSEDAGAVSVDAFPAADYTARLKQDGSGLHEELFQVLDVPVGADAHAVVVSRGDLPDSGLVLKCRAELSLDGGLTWSPKPSGEKVWPWGQFPMGFTISGGAFIGPGGKIAVESFVKFPLPDIKNKNRKIRVTFIPLKDVRTKVTCEFKVPA